MFMRKPVKCLLILTFIAAEVVFFNVRDAAAGLFSRKASPTETAKTATPATIGAQTGQAQSFVQDMGDQVIDYIIDANLTEAARKQKLEAVLKNNFDTYTISRFALGPHWRGLTAAEQEEYQELFADMIVAIYSRKFSDYNGQEFKVTGVRKAEDNDYLVQSIILQKDAKDIPVGWHLRNKDGKYQIVDVTVEDVSMIVTQKSEFSSIIQRRGGNPSVILDHLRNKLAEAG